MLEWIEVKDTAVRLVSGALRPDNTVDSTVLEACKRGYKRALFFCPELSDLEGFASTIREASFHRSLVPEGELPGRSLVSTVYRTEEATSLKGLMVVRQALLAIRDGEAGGPKKLNRLREVLRAKFTSPDLLSSGSIIPALHAPDPDELRRIRLTLQPVATVGEFSATLMKGAFQNPRVEREFYGHLENGYRNNAKQPSGAQSASDHRGWYKLTAKAAALLHLRLSSQPGWDQVRMPLEELAPVSATLGPRQGQISRALPGSWGCLIP